MQSFPRDPDSVLDWRWDWSARLAAGETISTATVDVPAGLTKHTPETNDDTTVTVWVSGGEPLQVDTLTCHIVTNQGREDDWSIRLHTQER